MVTRSNLWLLFNLITNQWLLKIRVPQFDTPRASTFSPNEFVRDDHGLPWTEPFRTPGTAKLTRIPAAHNEPMQLLRYAAKLQ